MKWNVKFDHPFGPSTSRARPGMLTKIDRKMTVNGQNDLNLQAVTNQVVRGAAASNVL
jgi:hypothetical protein